ncbi:MAG: hypothetical protein ABI877_04055 [Gemmatimonadaceae bacterium]
MTDRRGIGRLGCLLSLLLVGGVAYFGTLFGKPFMRFYRYRDAMQQEAMFVERSDDDAIRRRLVAFADSLGLPNEAAEQLTITRTPERIEISAEWSEHVEVSFFARDFHFAPRVGQER